MVNTNCCLSTVWPDGRFIFKSLANFNNEKLPNSVQNFLLNLKNTKNKTPKRAQDFLNFTIVAKFCQIWSHCRSQQISLTIYLSQQPFSISPSTLSSSHSLLSLSFILKRFISLILLRFPLSFCVSVSVSLSLQTSQLLLLFIFTGGGSCQMWNFHYLKISIFQC